MLIDISHRDQIENFSYFFTGCYFPSVFIFKRMENTYSQAS